MKFQPKRFVVEVKRGTSRAAFSSPDAGPDKFSSAEAMLFGTPHKTETVPTPRKSRAADEAPRRILESLVEPAAPEPAIEEEIERPRRGRKPGSKNKPKVASVPDGAPPPQLSAAALAFMRSPEPARPPAQPVTASDGFDDAPQAAADRPIQAALAVQADQNRRPRLRERSSIIKRYVLGIEPQPGQTGSLRARRQARAAR